eukprot:jgi/Botrbrau1/10017/Bobra.0012s0104.1
MSMSVLQTKGFGTKGVAGARLFRNLSSAVPAHTVLLSPRIVVVTRRFKVCNSQSSVVGEGTKGQERGEKPEPRQRQRRSQPASRGRRGGLQGRSTRQNEESFTGPLRLNKAIAEAGVASRRGADELILAGQVAVNNKVVVTPGIIVKPWKDAIRVSGKLLPKEAVPKYYFAVNKPKGYLCASKAQSPESRGKLVLDLFQDWFRQWRKANPDPKLPQPRLFTIGRLDVASSGLILVTNDGDWAQRVAHPSSGLSKEYVVTLEQKASKPQLEAIAAGMTMDGVFVQPEWVMPILDDPKSPRIRIVVNEGRNREVRNLVANAGLDVVYLKRVRIGGFLLPKDLSLGQVRLLKKVEVAKVTDRGAQSNPYANPFAL